MLSLGEQIAVELGGQNNQSSSGEAAYHRCFGQASLSLFNMDCLELLDRLPSGSVDVVITSPPYNLGIAYSSYNDSQPRESYLRWLDAWAEKVERVLAPEGSLFLNVGSIPTDPWVAFQAAVAVTGQSDVSALHTVGRFILQNTIHWIKSISLDGEHVGENEGRAEALSVGHYKPINSQRFINDAHEYVFHFTKHGRVPVDRLALGVPYQDKSNTTRWKSAKADKRCRGNIWFVPYETIQRRETDRPHPATFPVKLVEWALRLHGLSRAKLVLDPFMGLGSTAVACIRNGVSCLGAECDPEYFAVSCERLAAEFGEGAARPAFDSQGADLSRSS